MEYNEFKDYLKTKMEERFPDSEVDITSVVKNNDTVLDGIVIKNEESNIAPNIYVNQYYEQYENGRSMESIAETIAEIRMEHDAAGNFDIAKVLDWEEAKDHIICKLINEQDNQQYLSDKPYTQVEDLAATYHILMGSDEQGSATVAVHNGIMERLGVDVETLHQTAIENMDTLMPAKFTSMQSVMEEMLLPDIMRDMGISKEEAREMLRADMPEASMPFYVLTNENKVNGAACILNPSVKEQIAEQLGGDYYVLPSSIHETLILPKTADSDYRELETMVQEVNATQVEPEERLSDHVYEYDAAAHEFMRSDTALEKRAMRENPKEMGEKTEERKSLKEKLEEKRTVAASVKQGMPKEKERKAEPVMD